MRRADRDLAEQLAAVRKFAANASITVAKASADVIAPAHDSPHALESLGASGVSEEDWPTRPLFAQEDLQKRLAWARRLRPDAREGVLDALQRAADAGHMRRIGRPGPAADFAEMTQEFPHFNEVLNFVWNRALLAGSVADAAFRLPPILLDGPPGVGKSAFAERLAAWLRVPITRVDMSSLDAGFKLTGLDAGYRA